MLTHFFLTMVAIIIVHFLLNKNKYYNDIFIMQVDFVKLASKEKDLTTMALILLWIIGFLTVIIIMLSIINFPDNRTSLFSAFAILISAFMASIAMLKSIRQSKIHKEEEIKSKLEKNISYINDQANEIASVLIEIKAPNYVIEYKESLYELLSKKHLELDRPDITYGLDENLLQKFRELKYPLMKILLELFKIKNKTSFTGEQNVIFETIIITKDNAIELFTCIEEDYL